MILSRKNTTEGSVHIEHVKTESISYQLIIEYISFLIERCCAPHAHSSLVDKCASKIVDISNLVSLDDKELEFLSGLGESHSKGFGPSAKNISEKLIAMFKEI